MWGHFICGWGLGVVCSHATLSDAVFSFLFVVRGNTEAYVHLTKIISLFFNVSVRPQRR